MPLIDIECLDGFCCGVISEVNRPLSMWPATPPCPKCQSATQQIFLPPRSRWTLDPVVIYRAPDGSFRYPGDISGPGATKYDRMGYERIEMRSAADVRRYESLINKIEFEKSSRVGEREQAMRENRERHLRSELRQRMQSMSRLGRDVARAAMDRNNRKPNPRERGHDPNFHVQVFSTDRSNRE